MIIHNGVPHALTKGLSQVRIILDMRREGGREDPGLEKFSHLVILPMNARTNMQALMNERIKIAVKHHKHLKA